MELEGRSAIVTGGAGGLGSATAKQLHAAGLGVVVMDLDLDKAQAVADGLGDSAVAVAGSVVEDDTVTEAIAKAVELGPLAVLANIAGGAATGGRLVNRSGQLLDKEGFEATLDMNVVGTFNASRHVAKAMAENEPDEDGQRGVIVNTGSLAGLEGQAGQVAYSAAKAAILGMSLPLARDLSPMGIRVCAIAPGTIGTPIMKMAAEHLKKDPSDGVQFPKRMGHPEEYALLVEQIVRNSYLNGENIRLDGGLRFSPT